MTFLKKYKPPPEVFYKKSVRNTFTKFTRKHLCHSFFEQFYQKSSAP